MPTRIFWGFVQTVPGRESSLQRNQKGPTPEPLKLKETDGAGPWTPRRMSLGGPCIRRVLGGAGGGGGSGRPGGAGAVVVRIWPNLPAATQRASVGQERPKSALVTPLIRCSVSQVPEPPVGLVEA